MTDPAKPLAGKTALVTGATSGIGLSIAEGLARLGAHVLLVARDVARGQAAMQQINGRVPGARLELFQADLSAQAESGSLAERAKVSLVCLPDDARQRLKRLERIGFDEVLLVSPAGRLDELERVRDFL